MRFDPNTRQCFAPGHRFRGNIIPANRMIRRRNMLGESARGFLTAMA